MSGAVHQSGPRREDHAVGRAGAGRRGLPRDRPPAHGRAHQRRLEPEPAPRHPLPAERLLQAELHAGNTTSTTIRLRIRSTESSLIH